MSPFALSLGGLPSFPIPQLAGQPTCVFVMVCEARRYLDTTVSKVSIRRMNIYQLQCNHHRTSRAYNENFIIVSKIISTVKFLKNIYGKCHIE
jgi:hypothetical protein